MQKTMIRFLEEASERDKTLQRQLVDFNSERKTLGVHLMGLKSMLQVQQEIPLQPLLRKPFILIDAWQEFDCRYTWTSSPLSRRCSLFS
jgi:hypothetical protein